MSRIDTHAFGLWWKLAKGWFSTKFASINVDLTPVEEKLDDVKSDVADVKDAVENIDLSSVAKQKALQELYCPNNHANLIKWSNIWLVSTGVQYGGFIIYNNVDVTGTEFYVGAASNPQVGGVLYRATATTIDFSQQLQDTITEVKQIKLSTILDLIGTPATGQQPTLFQALNNINIDTSDLAKEATLGSSADTSVSTTVFGWLKSIRDFLVGIVTTNPYAKEATLGDVADVLDYIEQGGMPSITAIAKQGSNANATLSDTQAQATSAATDAAAAKTAAQAITGYALQGSDATATNTALAALIGYTIQEIDGV